MNKIIILGRICNDLEVKTVKKGKQSNKVLNFTVAVPRKMNREETDFIQCSAWNALAEHIEKYFKKGQRICIGGELRVTQTEKDGSNITYYNVICEDVSFCESAK